MGYDTYTNNSQYKDNIDQWDITYDCLNDAVKRGKTKYLASNELPASALNNPANVALNEYIKNTYKTRVLPMAVFYNFTASTLAAWIGTITRKPAAIQFADEGQDSLIDYLLYNADGSGNGIGQSAKKALETTIGYGGGLFVVSPPEGGVSQTSVREGSVAPRISVFDRRKILDWKYVYKNSVRQLSYLKLIDGRLDLSGIANGSDTLLIEYFLDDSGVSYSIKKIDKDGGEEVETEKSELIINGKRATKIPAFPFGANDNDLDVDSAPLAVIANKNIEHYQMSSRHQQQCYDAGQGQYHIDLGSLDQYGSLMQVDAEGKQKSPIEALNPGGLKLGSLVPIVTAGGGSVTLMQITTDNLLAQEPERIEKQAQKLGAIMMTEQSDATATAARIAASGMTAQLTTIADNVSRALTDAIDLIAEMVGYSYDNIFYELNKDLVDVVYTPQDKDADLKLVESGRLPEIDYFNKLKRMGEISQDKTFDEYKAEVQEAKDASMLAAGPLPQFGRQPAQDGE